MFIVDKFVNIEEFDAHVASLQFGAWKPSFVVVHNTSAPTLANYAEWRAHPDKHGNWTPEQWGKNLASYYSGMGWSAGPHAFVCPDGVLLFTPFTQRGTHSPSWNSVSWGIETVGEFESEPFDNGSRTNLIAALGILHKAIGLSPQTMRFHKEDPKTTHRSCPGRNMVKAVLIMDVNAYIDKDTVGEHIDIPLAVNTADTSALNSDQLNGIIWLQSGLSRLGFGPLAVDNKLGPATKAAVSAFQKANGLVVDGIPGPMTRLKLKELLKV